MRELTEQDVLDLAREAFERKLEAERQQLAEQAGRDAELAAQLVAKKLQLKATPNPKTGYAEIGSLRFRPNFNHYTGDPELEVTRHGETSKTQWASWHRISTLADLGRLLDAEDCGEVQDEPPAPRKERSTEERVVDALEGIEDCLAAMVAGF